MIRTQIYIPQNIHNKLTRLAKQRGEPMAEVVRELLEYGLEKKKNVDCTGKTAIENLLKIQATEGPRDLSKHIDYYLYGGFKKNESTHYNSR